MGTAPEEAGDDGGSPDEVPYTRRESRGVLAPTLALVAVLALLVIAWHLVRDTGPEDALLGDVDESGSFKLRGHWRENLTAYGPHAHAINLTLEEGDLFILNYGSHGPPDGIQVRLQHPLHPSDGANGSGGTRVFASSAGGNGTLQLSVREAGAFQVYFWHPGSIRAPGEGDDADAHITASVSYDLSVRRAHRP